MADRKSFLSRMRARGETGGGSERPEEPRPEAERPEEAPSPEPQAAGPQPPAAAELRLEPDHPFRRLWRIYADCVQDAPPPALSLEALLTGPEEGALLTREEAAADLPRLEQLVTKTAEARLTRYLERQAAARKIFERAAAEAAKRAGADAAEADPPPPPEELPTPNLDAELHVFFTAQHMAAWLLIYPHSGKGAALNAQQIKAALDAAGVCYGLDRELLDALPGRAECYFTLHPVARGVPPVHGKDGSIIDLFSRKPVHTVQEDESGRVDFASVEIFQSAKEGDTICRIIQPTPASDGRTVLGKFVHAHKGHMPSIPKGHNTHVSEEGDRLVASCGGHVEFNGRAFSVKPVLEIRSNVDFSTGNIRSVGDVHIFGDVRSGFSVKSHGSVTIEGMVEAASVEAGGDLVIRKGVQGGGGGVLRAQRDIFVKYMENCTAYARGSFEAESVISSTICCDRDVTVRSGRGVITGGKVSAGHDVSAGVMGSRSEVTTSVFLGGLPYEEVERDNLRRTVEELETRLEKLDLRPDSPAKLHKMSKTRMLIAANKLKLRQIEKDLDRLEREQARAQPVQGRLSCSLLYPGVEITIGSCFLRVEHETRSCMTSVSDGEIKLI